MRAHFKSSNIHRLEAAIRVYASLARLDQLRGDVLKKMIGMLLHPFPTVCMSAIHSSTCASDRRATG